MQPVISAMPTAAARALQAGLPDAYGRAPERKISDGKGNPCRHCLGEIPAGSGMLVCAYRPFGDLQPYAETGPVFLCADPCERRADRPDLPPMLEGRAALLVRGYGADERIAYGTGKMVAGRDCMSQIAAMFADPAISFVHIRSASNNCYQARADRG